MREVISAILNFGVNRPSKSLLFGALSYAKALLMFSKELGRFYLFTVRKGRKSLESQVYANGGGYFSGALFGYFNWNVHIPMPL